MSIIVSLKELAVLKELGDSFGASEIKSPNLIKKTPKKNSRKSQKESHEEVAARLKNEREESDQKLKVSMCNWVKFISTFYLIFVGITIWLCGNARVSNLNYISDSVLIALLTTTTITIIGLPALILHSLFPKEKGKNI